MSEPSEHPSRSDRLGSLVSTVLVGSGDGSPHLTRAVGLVTDLAAPVILSGLALHELLYNLPAWPIWALVTALIWVLVLRRRWPLAVFVVTLAVVLVLSALGVDSAADAALLVALYSVAAHRAFRFALVCAVVLEIGVFFVSRRFAPAGSIDDAVVLLTGLAAAVLFLGTTLRSRRGYLASVEDRARRLELERAQQAQLAALAERARIAREMHDIVGHGLTVVITLAEGAAAIAETEPARAREAMEQVAAGGRQSLNELRKLFGVLRSDESSPLAPQPGLCALPELVEALEHTGLRVELERTGELDALSDTVQATLFRIVQESLTNVIKHATDATRVRVELRRLPGAVAFSIRDDGTVDGPPATTGNGILGMRERVAIFDGHLEAAAVESGWRVSGELRVDR